MDLEEDLFSSSKQSTGSLSERVVRIQALKKSLKLEMQFLHGRLDTLETRYVERMRMEKTEREQDKLAYEKFAAEKRTLRGAEKKEEGAAAMAKKTKESEGEICIKLDDNPFD